MIKTKIDMTGWIMSEHGVSDSKLTVIKQVEDHIKPNGKHEAKWLCVCNCKKHTVLEVLGYSIRNGSTKSCGCLKNEKIRKYNTYKLYETYGIGIASNCEEKFYFDLEDYDLIKDFCWYKDITTGYMKTRTSENKWIYMHRLLTKNKYSLVDHINLNKLDNRKENLRKATKRVNILNRNGVISTNTSGITGVHFSNQREKWIAQICVSNQTKYIGCFTEKEDAIRARLQAEKEYFGEFAPQRHLFEEYGIEDDFSTNKKEE